MEKYYDTRSAARLMGSDVDAVREMCRTGVLKGALKDPNTQQWLIPESALTAWLEAGPKSAEGQSGGDSYSFSRVEASVIAAGRGAQVTIGAGSEAEIRRHFEPIYEQIQDRPVEKPGEREMILDTVKDIETEVVKKEEADESKLGRWFRLLAVMAPDILEVTLDTIMNPLKGISTVVKKIAERAKAENSPAGP
jgi:hypothetical protein